MKWKEPYPGYNSASMSHFLAACRQGVCRLDAAVAECGHLRKSVCVGRLSESIQWLFDATITRYRPTGVLLSRLVELSAECDAHAKVAQREVSDKASLMFISSTEKLIDHVEGCLGQWRMRNPQDDCLMVGGFRLVDGMNPYNPLSDWEGNLRTSWLGVKMTLDWVAIWDEHLPGLGPLCYGDIILQDRIVDGALMAHRKINEMDDKLPGFASLLYGDIWLFERLDVSSWSGSYNEDYDRICLAPLDLSTIARDIAHELAHRYWRRFAPVRLKVEWVGWDVLCRSLDSMPSEYAKTNTEEHFCEAVSRLSVGSLNQEAEAKLTKIWADAHTNKEMKRMEL